MACRPGPLRAERSLRDVYIPSVALPLVANKLLPTKGRPTAKPQHKSRSDRRPRRAPARQRYQLFSEKV
jgi:hypothetical protein